MSDEVMRLAEEHRDAAIKRMQEGSDAADEIQALIMAGLALSRIWMPPEDVSAWLTKLSEQTTEAAEMSRKSSH